MIEREQGEKKREGMEQLEREQRKTERERKTESRERVEESLRESICTIVFCCIELMYFSFLFHL
jgi:hypothetical protein